MDCAKSRVPMMLLKPVDWGSETTQAAATMLFSAESAQDFFGNDTEATPVLAINEDDCDWVQENLNGDWRWLIVSLTSCYIIRWNSVVMVESLKHLDTNGILYYVNNRTNQLALIL